MGGTSGTNATFYGTVAANCAGSMTVAMPSAPHETEQWPGIATNAVTAVLAMASVDLVALIGIDAVTAVMADPDNRIAMAGTSPIFGLSGRRGEGGRRQHDQSRS